MLTWVLPFVGYFLLFTAWAVATPYDGSPDEMRHIQRAYGVASGEFAPAPAREGKFAGAYQDVPKSLIRTNCFAFRSNVPASCGPAPGGDETKVRVLTPAGRYNPAYYLVVGWPLVLSPTMAGVLLARIVSAALVAALLAWATAVAIALRRRGVLAGLLVAVTPMAAYLAGAINPNGVEIAAGAALVVALIGVLLEPDGPAQRRSVWWLAAVAGGVLLTVRPAGPAWFAVIAAVLFVPLAASRYRALLTSRRFWSFGAALAVVGLAAAGWTVWKRANELTPNAPPRPNLTFVDSMKIEFFDQWRRHVSEMVGVLSWLDTPLPVVVHLAWWMSVGALVVLAVLVGRPADRWRVVGLAALGMLVPAAVEALNASQYGFIAQGRYYLPMLVGVPILAAYVITARSRFDLTPQLTRLFAVVLVPIQVAVLCYLMVRYQQGLPAKGLTPSLNPFAGSWHPALGSVLPVLLALAAAALLIVFHYRITADPTGAAGPGEVPLNGRVASASIPQDELTVVAAEPRRGEETA
ncbi:DUF2142 domain-containing protein [Micromonospora sp. NPDC049559]|uniref:DUF2142 domain-containing protein n=1 Tax=Micromonospora sp. NPDC049559 TaxID=3155923 RepID=UPI0034187CEA